MHYGYGMHANKSFEFRNTHGSVHVVAIGIGPVEDNYFLLLFRTRFHHVMHGTDVGIKPGAHVLNIKNKDVYIFQVFRFCFFICSIQRNHR